MWEAEDDCCNGVEVVLGCGKPKTLARETTCMKRGIQKRRVSLKRDVQKRPMNRFRYGRMREAKDAFAQLPRTLPNRNPFIDSFEHLFS